MGKFDEADKGARDPRLAYPQVGFVTNRDDPHGLGRVRVNVPGLLEPESAWAWPLGSGEGKDAGDFSVPALGSLVVLWFVDGERENVMYMSGWPTLKEVVDEDTGDRSRVSEVPIEAQRTPPDNHVWSTPGFRIELDETEGARRAAITVVKTGDRLEFDEETNTVTLKATTNLVLIADGQVTIEGIVVVINGRVVRPSGESI